MNSSRELTDEECARLQNYRRYKEDAKKEIKQKKIIKTSTNCFKNGKIIHNTNYYSSGLNIVTIRAPNGHGIFFSRDIKSMEEIMICESERKHNKNVWIATFGVNSAEWKKIFEGENQCTVREEEEEEEEEWNFGESNGEEDDIL